MARVCHCIEGFGIAATAAAAWGYNRNRALSVGTSVGWWTSVFPGVAIVLVVLGVTLVGESLNDLSDPRLRTRRRAGGSRRSAAKAEAAAAAAARADAVKAGVATAGGEK